MFNVTVLFYADCFFLNADSVKWSTIWTASQTLICHPKKSLWSITDVHERAKHIHTTRVATQKAFTHKDIEALYTHAWSLELYTWTFEHFIYKGSRKINYWDCVLFCLIYFIFFVCNSIQLRVWYEPCLLLVHSVDWKPDKESTVTILSILNAHHCK